MTTGRLDPRFSGPAFDPLSKEAEYESGHMVYAHTASLKALHDNVAAFILKTANLKRD